MIRLTNSNLTFAFHVMAALLVLDHADVCFSAARNRDVIVDQHGRINRFGKQIADLIARLEFTSSASRTGMT